jgi:hypothetical protein
VAVGELVGLGVCVAIGVIVGDDVASARVIVAI